MARRWAVLIDADNVSADIADPLFARLATWGDASVRRMYGNFDGNHIAWKEAAARHSIRSEHLPLLTQSKNGADMALVIDAMDLMHRGNVDGFCLVSSDCDFTSLAWRLREEGKTVRAVGKGTAVSAFRSACSEFIKLEMLTGPKFMVEVKAPHVIPKSAVCIAVGKLEPKMAVSLIDKAIASLPSSLEWYGLGGVGSAIKKLVPSFDARNYAGCSSLKDVVKKSGAFRMRITASKGAEIARNT